MIIVSPYFLIFSFYMLNEENQKSLCHRLHCSGSAVLQWHREVRVLDHQCRHHTVRCHLYSLHRDEPQVTKLQTLLLHCTEFEFCEISIQSACMSPCSRILSIINFNECACCTYHFCCVHIVSLFTSDIVLLKYQCIADIQGLVLRAVPSQHATTTLSCVLAA